MMGFRVGTTIKATGFDEISLYLRQLMGVQRQNHEKAAVAAAGVIYDASQILCPVESGALKKSGKVIKERSGWSTTASVVYGEGSGAVNPRTGKNPSEYAIYVHEDLDAMHGWRYNLANAKAISQGKEMAKGPLEQAKFLEEPMRTERYKALEAYKLAMQIT